MIEWNMGIDTSLSPESLNVPIQYAVTWSDADGDHAQDFPNFDAAMDFCEGQKGAVVRARHAGSPPPVVTKAPGSGR